MRYAVIADIHGNMPAFSAVLKDAARHDIGAYILLGDFCACFPQINEVIDTIKSLNNVYTVKGNEDDYILNLIGKDQSGFTDGQFRTVYWTYRNLSPENLDYLASLPDTLDLPDFIVCAHKHSAFFGGTSFDMLGSPNYAFEARNGNFTCEAYYSALESVFTRDEALLDRLASHPAQIFLAGHVHMQYHFELGGKHIINPGACGLPLDGEVTAPYTIIDIVDGNCHVTERRVEYDISDAVGNLRTSSLYAEAPVWSEVIISELESGRERAIYFLRHAESFAKNIGDGIRPYTRETFAAAYKSWLSGPPYRDAE